MTHPKYTHLKIFVSCPNDVEKEKKIVNEYCQTLTYGFQKSRNITVSMIDWKNSITPLITGETTQTSIDRQIDEYDYDIYIGIMWKRFGDRQRSGLTPTEGEFEQAFKRYKETKRPLIQFYFKVNKFYPNNRYEALQILEVLKFKERIKSLDIGLYSEFKDEKNFRTQIQKNLLYIIENFGELTAKKKIEIKIQNPDIPVYLNRKICLFDTYKEWMSIFVLDDMHQDLIEIVKKQNRIVVLGDAGTGKTIELIRLARSFEGTNSGLYPKLVNLNKYVNQHIVELLPNEWANIADDKWLIIFDGLDEIESRNRNNFIRQIESFSEQHSQSKIIISSRTNFYKAETEHSSGTIQGFSSYILLGLEEKEIERCIIENLGQYSSNFDDLILNNGLRDLLPIPFYLINLVSLFKENKTLPNSKAAIFEELLRLRIRQDEEKFRTTISNIDRKRSKIIPTLEKVALTMETIGRNFINDEEYLQIVPDDEDQELIEYYSIWKKQVGQNITWQFEHANFQEYLAAKVLARKSLTTIKDFVSFKPNCQKLIPSWINTLSFLLSLTFTENQNFFNEISDWIINIEPEVLVKFEPDKIDLQFRIKTFKKIFNSYKEKQIWINRDKFSYRELARFGESEEIINFLLDEIEEGQNEISQSIAVDLISHMQINSSQRAIDTMVSIALNDELENETRCHAMIALTSWGANSLEVVNKIIPELRSSKNDWLRYGIYYFLHNSDYLDDNIDVFLEGIEYARYMPLPNRDESRLFDERWHLRVGLEKAKTANSVRKILAYFSKNPNHINLYFDKELSKIAENAACLYKENPEILEDVLTLLLSLTKEHEDKEAEKIIIFFDITETKNVAFEKLLSKKNQIKSSYPTPLILLTHKETIKIFIKEYEGGKITDEEVWSFQNHLMWKKKKLFETFYKLINKASNNQFKLAPQKDYEKERMQRLERDIEVLFDKQKFVKEAEQIFKLAGKENLKSIEIYDTADRSEQFLFSNIVPDTIRDLANKKSISLEGIKSLLDQFNWESFCIRNIYNKMIHNKNTELSPEQIEWISEWCYKKVKEVDFKKAISKGPDGRFSANSYCIYVSFFLRKLNLKFPEKVLLDMLSFEWFEGTQFVEIDYIEERVSKNKITKRILENLNEGILWDPVLINHLKYCKKHNIKAVLPYAEKAITDNNRDKDVRQVALETTLCISGNFSRLEEILLEVKDDFRWKIVDAILQRNNSNLLNYLQNALKDENEQDQIIASGYLIKLQDLSGLEFYVKWVEKNKHLPGLPFDQNPLYSLRTIDALPHLIRLLKICYEKQIAGQFSRRFDRVVLDTLEAIALRSEKNFLEISKKIERFIKENSNVNFLHIYLERLEQKFYANKSQDITVKDALKKLAEIDI